MNYHAWLQTAKLKQNFLYIFIYLFDCFDAGDLAKDFMHTVQALYWTVSWDFFKLFFIFLLFYVYECFSFMYVRTKCMQFPKKPEEGIRFPGN